MVKELPVEAGKSELWHDDRLQFARLISEFFAVVGITKGDWNQLKATMDLEDEALNNIIARADDVYEAAKEELWIRPQ